MNKKYFYYFIFCLLLFASYMFVLKDKKMSKERLQYLINKIDDYNTSYGTYPKSINNIGIPLDGNNHRESFCNMHETMLDGWGYCYYAYYDESNDYVIYIYIPTCIFPVIQASLKKKKHIYLSIRIYKCHHR